MKLVLISIIAMLFILGACTPEEPEIVREYVCPDGSIVNDLADCPEEEEEEVMEEEEDTVPPVPDAEMEEEKHSLSDELKELLERPDSRVQSFSYTFRGQPNRKELYEFHIKGDMIRVDIPEVRDLTSAYDVVYLDVVEEKAVAYCEIKASMCSEYVDVEYEVNFDDYYFITPYQWLKQIDSGIITGEEQVFKRNTKRVEFEYEDELYVAWLDAFYGLPLKVEKADQDVQDDSEKILYEYDNMVVNEVTDDDLVHQSRRY